MSQVNSNASSVQNLAGDTSANIQETGANQRFKADLALREQQLKLEQAKLKVEKYGIDSSRAGYANLNESNERIAGQRNATELAGQQQQAALAQQQMAQEQANFQERNRITMAVDERNFQYKLEEDAAHNEIQRTLLRGQLDLLKGQQKQLASFKERVAAVEFARSVIDKDEATIRSGWSNVSDASDKLLTEAERGEQNGINAGEPAALRLGLRMAEGIVKPTRAATPDDPSFSADPRQHLKFQGVGNLVKQVVSGGEIGKPIVTAEVYKDGPEMAKELVTHWVDGAADHLVDDPAAAGRVKAVLTEVMNAWLEHAGGDELAGFQGPPNPATSQKVQEAWGRLMAMPEVNKSAVVGALSALQDFGLKSSMALEKGELDLIRDPQLKDQLKGVMADKDARSSYLKGFRLLGGALHGVRATVGDSNMHTAESIRQYVRVVQRGLSEMMGPEKFQQLLAEKGVKPERWAKVDDILDIQRYLKAGAEREGALKTLKEGLKDTAAMESSMDLDAKIQALSGALDATDITASELEKKRSLRGTK